MVSAMVRILVWFLEIGVLTLLASLAFVTLAVKGRGFSGMVRAAASLVMAATASVAIGVTVGVGAGLNDAHDPVGGALLAMILSLPITVWAFDRLGRRRGGTDGGVAGPSRVSAAPEPERDGRVASAWARAARLAPGQRQRIAAAREASAYVLHWAEANPMDIEAIECAVLIRKRLPELVDQTAHYCTLADKAERRAALDGMVADLDRIGEMALRRVERVKSQLGDSLAVTRAHIGSRTTQRAAIE